MKHWRFLSIAAIVMLLAVALLPINKVSAAAACSITYTNQNDWGAGATINVTITNTGNTAYSSWTIAWTFSGNQVINNLWNGTYTQNGTAVSVVNMSYNGTIAANGGTANFGFNIAYSGTNAAPTAFTVNGVACGGGGGGATNTPTRTSTGPTNTRTRTPTRTNTPSGPTNTPTRTPTRTNTPSGPTNTPTRTPTQGSGGTHLSNPFSGAKWFVNPAWVAEVNASSVTASQKSLLTQQNTAVWLDSMAAVTGTSGYPYSITGWLDQAVSQGANLIIFVVYDLPGRDCAALASNGEIPGTAAGLTTYETSYIDPIAAAEGQSKYSNIRIINIVEPDSLPNLVTNLSVSACANANSLGLYSTGIEYALNKLHAIPNTYNYLDIGHSGWLGWSSNFSPAITLISNVVKATTAGVNSIDGFISNTANTVPVTEPFMTATESIGGNQVESVTFYSYDPYIEEDTYDAAWKSAMQAAGLPASSTNMLVDTSRNGWGGCGGGPNVSQNCRPTAASTSTDVNTFVTMSRIDRRPARGDWCNQNGAGIGARPAANPGGPYQAYVWIKPPGESDGSSSLIPTGPNNPNGKGFDRMCDPTYGGNSMNQNSPTNALPNAPVSGAWFEAQFDQLVANAYPAIP